MSAILWDFKYIFFKANIMGFMLQYCRYSKRCIMWKGYNKIIGKWGNGWCEMSSFNAALGAFYVLIFTVIPQVEECL
jgi:hypothetical protein